MNKILFTLVFLLSFILILGLSNKLIQSFNINKNNISQESSPLPENSPLVIENQDITPSPETTQNTEETQPPENTPYPTLDPAIFNDVNGLLILASKTHPLPEGYEPSDLVGINVKVNKSGLSLRKEAAAAIEEMFAAASEDGITLVLGSSYRSAAYQEKLYNNYVAKDGEELASKYSSKPGQSEHQTGLAVDISDASGATYLSQKFKDTEEGKWLKDNAHRFGFIMRYPEGKEDITGYMFEPWHFRYVGIDYATKIYEADTTFEEYFGILD